MKRRQMVYSVTAMVVVLIISAVLFRHTLQPPVSQATVNTPTASPAQASVPSPSPSPTASSTPSDVTATPSTVVLDEEPEVPNPRPPARAPKDWEVEVYQAFIDSGKVRLVVEPKTQSYPSRFEMRVSAPTLPVDQKLRDELMRPHKYDWSDLQKAHLDKVIFPTPQDMEHLGRAKDQMQLSDIFRKRFPGAEGIYTLSLPIKVGDEAVFFYTYQMGVACCNQAMVLRRHGGHWKVVKTVLLQQS